MTPLMGGLVNICIFTKKCNCEYNIYQKTYLYIQQGCGLSLNVSIRPIVLSRTVR